ncbi:MAG: HD domain-containing protein [Victivallales bacterium]
MDYSKAKQYILGRMEKEVPLDFRYHNLRHSLDVLQSAERLASAENITGKDLDLLKTAALFHDSGFIFQYTCNESVGCEIARQSLPEFGYSATDIERICGMIMATAVPQRPANKLEQILCDADLDYLGRGDFEIIAETLREELNHRGREFTEREWIAFQLDFMEKHRYFTEAARKLRDAMKRENIDKLKRALHVAQKEGNQKSEDRSQNK